MVDVVAPLTSTYAPSDPVDLARTLRPLSRGHLDPTLRWDSTGVWRTTRTPAGPATLHLAGGAAGVVASVWGDGAQWALDGVPELLGAGDDADGFDVSGHPLLSDLHRRMPGLRLLRTNRVLEAALPAVLEQKVTGIEARRAWRRLILAHGDAAPGPAPEGMRVLPAASGWEMIPSWEWHAAGVGPQRSKTAIRVARVAEALERTLALGRGGPAVERALRSIPGVGVWTAAEIMQRAHGDPDSPSVGDYHLATLVGWALVGEAVDDDGMLELLEPWRGHRQRVVRLIEASGVRPPARGPRMTVQDHRAH